uniref:NADH-FMN oxidoreductase RutF, flavin reductase (DIM6/NTAB) family n=1 Tax=Candidatus Kentrum sp. DK TaxID=2126562 RepID=A0A450S387_9GAMM|nr:MAG: NADH-FMN oxidoreductase RutF, flavin reductase (DIM6/NTAB) family [Candidatus Kentron sp. DK]
MPKTIQTDPTQWFPMPAMLVTCASPEGKPNVMSIGYVGFCCWDPPIISLGINESRYTRAILAQTRELVVNVPEAGSIVAMDYCGFVSGATVDKFAASGLTPVPATKVRAPLIAECPVNLECRVNTAMELGSHHLFIAEVLVTHVDSDVVDNSALTPVILMSRFYTGAARGLHPFGVSGGRPPEGADCLEIKGGHS